MDFNLQVSGDLLDKLRTEGFEITLEDEKKVQFKWWGRPIGQPVPLLYATFIGEFLLTARENIQLRNGSS